MLIEDLVEILENEMLQCTDLDDVVVLFHQLVQTGRCGHQYVRAVVQFAL